MSEHSQVNPGMDPASTAINTAANAADACRQIWQLCELWHDAPKEISQLRDDLAQANEFFSMVQLAVTAHTWLRTADWVGQLTYELEECFHKAETVVREVQAILHSLLNVSLNYGLEISNKRRRALWLRCHDEVKRLRAHLKDAIFEICSILALLDDPDISTVGNSSPGMKHAAEATERGPLTSNLAITDWEQGEPPGDENHDGYEMTESNRLERTKPVRRVSSNLALERHDPERHKSRWDEHKRLVAQKSPRSGNPSSSPCPGGCICACHSVKDWGRWALHFPLVGTLTVTHRGVTKRTPCSNPRCRQSDQSQRERLIRMDIYPSVWLLRATISVFLSFGLPSPELLLRVNKVIELTDVHSYMNQLLWAVQREESHGVKHFLQNRLVRADDIYGDPLNGFTPLRLALDRKSGEVASLLYASGGFHGALPASAASSLLLWLEQDPAAADFLTQHFPLSAVIEEADYNTLHQIIIGLRHGLDLHEYLRTPEALALVNQPNAFGRTPLHVAALRGNAEAVVALLDAGAARDARAAHEKHALHYACKAGSREVVDALVARGASLQVRDNLQRTPLFDLVGYGSNTNPNLVTHLLALGIVQEPGDWVKATLLALAGKRTAAVERLLPYWPPAHELPLYPAIHIGFPAGVRLLLEYGADYRTIDAFGEGILHWLAGSGLEMLRLFKGVGIRGVDVERRDNRDKTAVEIMEGRWDLTEEFRTEFMELLDEIGEAVEEQRDRLEGESDEVAEIEHEAESDGGDLSEDDEFFDAQDNPASPSVNLEGRRGLDLAAREAPSEPEDSQPTNLFTSDNEVLSSTEQDEHGLHNASNRTVAHEEKLLLCKPEARVDSDTEPITNSQEKDALHDGQASERWELEGMDDVSYNQSSEQKHLATPRTAKLEEDKVFTDEAGLKFLGTSDALRS